MFTLTLSMEIRAAALLLLFLGAIIFTTTEGHVPNCCLKTSNTIKPKILEKAEKYDIQSDAGPCELKAVVLYVGKKKYCLNPKLQKMVKQAIMKKQKHGKKQNKP